MAERTAQVATAPDGRTVMFAEWGDLNGAPVVALHATPGCRLDRHPDEGIARSAGVRLITYDRPGYGGSSRHRGRRVVECVPDVAAVADALGLAQFAVVGWGGGAPHALAVAARLGARVSRVCCAAGVAPFDAMGEEWFAGMSPAIQRELTWAFQGEDRLAAALRQEDSERRHAVLAARDDDSLDAGVDDLSTPRAVAGAAAADVLRRVTFEQTRNGVWGWVDDDLALTLPWGFDPSAIAVPARVEFGLGATPMPVRHGEWLAARIPAAEVTVSQDREGDARGAELADLLAWLRLAP